MLMSKPRQEVKNPFQRELDKKLQDRRSKGFAATGFSEDDTDNEDDDIGEGYSDEDFDIDDDDDDDLLKQFATDASSKKKSGEYRSPESSEDDDNEADSSMFMKTMNPYRNEKGGSYDLLQQTINPSSDFLTRNSSSKPSDSFEQKSPTWDNLLRGESSKTADILGHTNPKTEDILGQKSPEVDDIYGRKSPKMSDISRRMTPPRITDVKGRKSPDIKNEAPKPRHRRNLSNNLSSAFDFDLNNDNNGEKFQSKSPLLDILKQRDAKEQQPVAKQRNLTKPQRLMKSTDDLIDSLLNTKHDEVNTDSPSRATSPYSKESREKIERHLSSASSVRSHKSQVKDNLATASPVNPHVRHSIKFEGQNVEDMRKKTGGDEITDLLANLTTARKEESFVQELDDNNATYTKPMTLRNQCNENAIENVARSNSASALVKRLEESAEQDEIKPVPAKTRAKSARKPKPPAGYNGLGSLTAHTKLQTIKLGDVVMTTTSSSGDIRDTVYLEWLSKREQIRKIKRVEERQEKKEAEKKAERELREKKEENELARRAWLERKDKERRKKEGVRRRVERDRREEELRKEEDRWKNSKKCDVIRRKALEAAREKHASRQRELRKEEVLKQQDEEKRKKENKKAMDDWSKKRGSKWRDDGVRKKREERERREREEREKRVKDEEARLKYEEWYERKASASSLSNNHSTLVDEERPVWSPASKLVPTTTR